jgi:Fic family protein
MLPDKIVKIDQLKKELETFKPVPENQAKWWKKIRLDWNFNSNHIEGNTLTYGETQLLLIFDKTTGDHELREYQEMKAHDVAIHLVRDWANDKGREISESDIRELNRIILVKPYWKEAITPDGQVTKRQIKVGEYKEFPNSVRLKNGEIFEYTSPLETPQKMAELVSIYRNRTNVHPLVSAAQLHYDFIRIHPFDDGNGRVARLLMNYDLIRNGYPPVVIPSQEKEKYLVALQKADTGDIQAFHAYIADQLLVALDLAVRASKGEDLSEPEDYEKELKQISLSIKSHQNDVLKKTQGLLDLLHENSIKPLCTELYAKILKSADLFTEFEIAVYREGTGKRFPHIDHQEVVEKLFRPESTTHRMQIEYELKGFKGGQASAIFNVRCSVHFEFSDFFYIVMPDSNDRKTEIKKLYSQQLSAAEISRIVKLKTESLLKDIKQNFKSVTGKEL